MSKVRAYCEAGWSGLSMTVFVGLLACLLYWTVLQRPTLTFDTAGLKMSYVATRGTQLYVENPIYPPDTNMSVQISSTLREVNGYEDYRLSSIDSRGSFKPSIDEPKLSFVRPGYPVYGVFIPSYVKPGIYTYKAQATYRLNVFRTITLELPELTVIVE